MPGEWILLISGVVLLLVAAFGAAARARVANGATVSRTARAAFAGAGALCVTAALILGSEPAQTAGAPVTARITNELGSGQVSERIRVFLDGRDVGVLAVDRKSPKAQLRMSVSRAGNHAYRLVFTRLLVGGRPTSRTSEGHVVIDGRSPLVLYADASGRVYLGL